MLSATIYATGACNLRCKHCSVGMDHYKPREQLSTDEIKSAITNLTSANVSIVTLLGGEPTFSRFDLPEIYRHADQFGANISLNTNLNNRKVLEKIIGNKSFSNVVVSLDGLSAKTHDFMRGKGQFRKTMRNLIWLIKQRRERRLGFEIHITFVITKENQHEAVLAMARLSKIGVDKVNYNRLAISGRAKIFEDKLRLESAEIIETTAKIIIYWMISRKIEMSIHIPPAVSYYINQKWGTTRRIENAIACGGPKNSYGYIDLKGNHLPCPAMAVEENPKSFLANRSERLDIVTRDIQATWETSLFREFERSRLSNVRAAQMWPCKTCRFLSKCSPCTASVIKNEINPEVVICASLHDYISTNDPNRMEEIFGGPN